jgi:hypothetical protein
VKALLASWRALLLLACALSLANVSLMAFAVLVPRALPVMIAMSVGQAAGWLSLAAFLAAIFLERYSIRRKSNWPT